MDAGLAALPRPVRALEVGCGDGFFTGQLAERGCDAIGIDLSPVGVEAAQKRFPKARFQVHDLTRPMPFDDGSFDFVWCSEVLEHLFSPLAVLEEIRRVLRPGGRARLTVPYHGLLKNLGIALLAFEKHYDPTYPHIRFFTRKSLSDLVRRAGLTVESVGACGSNLGLRDWIVKTNILLAARKD
jgi:SAM-dependent methyltransferase